MEYVTVCSNKYNLKSLLDFPHTCTTEHILSGDLTDSPYNPDSNLFGRFFTGKVKVFPEWDVCTRLADYRIFFDEKLLDKVCLLRFLSYTHPFIVADVILYVMNNI